MPQISTDLEVRFRRKNFAEEGFFGYFFYLNLDQFSYFLMNLALFVIFGFKDYSWQAVPDLPRPLPALGAILVRTVWTYLQGQETIFFFKKCP